MPAISQPPGDTDRLWEELRIEAQISCEIEPSAERLISRLVLDAPGFNVALSSILSDKLASKWIAESELSSLFEAMFQTDHGAATGARNDLRAVRDRDPVARGVLVPFLFFKGFQAIQSYRLSHWLWSRERRVVACLLQSRISEVFAVDIHPAARLGSGILIDHATSVIVGETAVIENDVSILHEVTLGGTGKQTGDRHPKVRRGVLIGAGAKVLGNVEIGEGAKIGAGSVVLDPVPPHCTVAGVPAKIVSRSGARMPAFEMDQRFPHEYVDGSGI